MNAIKILFLKIKLWREMRTLSKNQKKQLVERIWWELEPNENKLQKLALRIYATKLYKYQLEKRFHQ